MSINNQIKTDFNSGDLVKNKEDLRIYEESDHYIYLIYHKFCRAMVGKANVLNRFDEWEMICHNCKRIMPINSIKFVRVEKKEKEK